MIPKSVQIFLLLFFVIPLVVLALMFHVWVSCIVASLTEFRKKRSTVDHSENTNVNPAYSNGVDNSDDNRDAGNDLEHNNIPNLENAPIHLPQHMRAALHQPGPHGPIECEVCYNTYESKGGKRNKTSRLPRILKCGHSVCTQCILSLDTHTNRIGGLQIKCPFCRAECHYDNHVKIPVNAALVDFLKCQEESRLCKAGRKLLRILKENPETIALMCKRCKKPFNNSDRFPWVSPYCGHTTCSDCILTLENGVCKCSGCSRTFYLDDYGQPGLWEFQKNYTLLNILEST